MEDLKKLQLNWYNEPNLTRSLREIFQSRSRVIRPFKTIRLGDNWATRLSPDMDIEITIGFPGPSVTVLGVCTVCTVLKTKIMWLQDKDLVQNIGAKSQHGVLSTMQKVYAPTKVSMDSIVTVIELFPRKPEKEA